MKTDRELLELAAYAAGLDGYTWDEEWKCMSKAIPEPIAAAGFVYVPWNPLKADADAFRLAVRLRVDIGEGVDKEPCAWVSYVINNRLKSLCEPYADNPYAATRRAITRAAAAIGQSMKEQK